MDQTRLRTLPSPDEIRQLPLFENIARQNIVLIQNLEQCRAIEAELKTAAVLGFDSESKPTFNVVEVSTGPHLIQLATLEKAYLFQINDEIWQFLQPIFANRDQIKVGFGLKNDAHLFRKKGIQLNSVIKYLSVLAVLVLKVRLGLKMPWPYYFTFISLKAEVLVPQIGHANSSVKHKLPMLLPMPTRLC